MSAIDLVLLVVVFASAAWFGGVMSKATAWLVALLVKLWQRFEDWKSYSDECATQRERDALIRQKQAIETKLLRCGVKAKS